MSARDADLMQLHPVKERIVQLSDPLLDEKQITFYVHHSDAGPFALRGNKWHKLKYNLLEAHRLGMDTLLTFGGAWSNHIAATACAAKLYGFKSIGIIRGEETLPLNKTLREAIENGMAIHYENRTSYRLKDSGSYLQSLIKNFGNFYLIPEGGSNPPGMKGCASMIEELDFPFDIICCPCGTGTTLAGYISALKQGQQAIGFSVLKNGGFLNEKIGGMLKEAGCLSTHWLMMEKYHFGGYAKSTDELKKFISDFERDHGIKTEPVYSGKMFFGLFEMIKNDFFKPRTILLAIHTGGLQYLSEI
jgi:1-aminocyclopropane-1-carboxylate deaminase